MLNDSEDSIDAEIRRDKELKQKRIEQEDKILQDVSKLRKEER